MIMTHKYQSLFINVNIVESNHEVYNIEIIEVCLKPETMCSAQTGGPLFQ